MTGKSQTPGNHYAGPKLKGKGEQKLMSIRFPPGDQVFHGHDMEYVHLLPREGKLVSKKSYTHGI